MGGGPELLRGGTRPSTIAFELEDSEVEGRCDGCPEPTLSPIASALRMSLLRSSFKEVCLDTRSPSVPRSSENPAAYMSMASSTVIPPAFDPGRDCMSTVESLMDVPLVATLLRLLCPVLVVSTRLEVVVRADRKLDLTSS